MEEDEESNWSLGRLSLPAEGRRSLERLREVNTVEQVEGVEERRGLKCIRSQNVTAYFKK